MKKIILPIYLFVGCASMPVNIKNYSGLKQDNIEKTYMLAQEHFVSVTKCIPPKHKNIAIQDSNIVALNTGRNIIMPDGLAFVIGLYAPEIETIFLAMEHPDRTRILFHEFIHFMFEQSPNCEWAAKNVELQHVIIREMESTYLKKTKRITIGDEWLIRALNAYGFKLKQI
jgi:hypothetical protein